MILSAIRNKSPLKFVIPNVFFDMPNITAKLHALDSIRPAARNSRPGAWNDADALVIGAMRPRGPVPDTAVLSPNECYTHVSLWAISASPLMIGCRLDELDGFTRSLLVNDEVIEVDQDLRRCVRDWSVMDISIVDLDNYVP